MMCCHCQGNARKHGRDRKGIQRFKCRNRKCGKTFLEDGPKPLGDMRIDPAKAVLALKLLAEGNSIRSIERLTDLHRDTLCRLLVTVGRSVERYMDQRIMNVPAEDVQADELWSFVQMKQRTKRKKKIEDPWIGDQYCFVGMERNSKLILAWHLGQRTRDHAVQFLDKLAWVTGNRFQLSTDAWPGYKDTVHYCLGGKVDFATVEKRYAQPPTDQGRYSPPVVVGVKKRRVLGRPNSKRISTSHIERQNLTIRTQVKRLARLTLSFSKKWENLKAALAWHFAYYNFVRVHGSLRVTPAMEAGLTDHIWTVEELLETAAA